jgi:hypothetical protein
MFKLLRGLVYGLMCLAVTVHRHDPTAGGITLAGGFLLVGWFFTLLWSVFWRLCTGLEIPGREHRRGVAARRGWPT